MFVKKTGKQKIRHRQAEQSRKIIKLKHGKWWEKNYILHIYYLHIQIHNCGTHKQQINLQLNVYTHQYETKQRLVM